jgi:hypothetical protein
MLRLETLRAFGNARELDGDDSKEAFLTWSACM